MAETNQAPDLQGPPDKPQPGAINPASAQGRQAQSQPTLTQVDTTTTAGATATQMDSQGRVLGVEGRKDGPDDAPDTGPSESPPPT